MARGMGRYEDDRGPSARHLVLMFLAAVAVCAVFFALGFVVGYNQSPSKVAPVTENVTSGGNIPPNVNPPTGGASQPSERGVQTEKVNPGSTSSPKPLRPEPLRPKSAAKSQPTIPRAQERPAPQRKPKSRPPNLERKVSSSRAIARSGLDFAVQVMASRAKADAENLVKLLKSHGYRAFVLTPQQAHAKDKLYRVQVGPFASRVQADRARDKLESEGFRPFVVHKRP